MPVKTFISYHHMNDQNYKEILTEINGNGEIFDDYSVNSGEIDDEYMSDEQIRVRVRDEYLREATVTVILVGVETRYRKHVDWELYSSMRDSALNKKSGIVLVPLPATGITSFTAAHGIEEKQAFYPENTSWVSLTRAQYEERYPHFSARMIDNLASGKARMSVVPWGQACGVAPELKARDRAGAQRPG